MASLEGCRKVYGWPAAGEQVKISGNLEVDYPIQRVWDLLQDPATAELRSAAFASDPPGLVMTTIFFCSLTATCSRNACDTLSGP